MRSNSKLLGAVYNAWLVCAVFKEMRIDKEKTEGKVTLVKVLKFYSFDEKTFFCDLPRIPAELTKSFTTYAFASYPMLA